MKFLDFIHNTKTQAFLSYVIIIGGFSIVCLAHLTDTVNNRLFDLMFLTATFYFGSSKSGSEKDSTIASLANQTTQPIATTDKGDINVTQ